MSLSVAEEVVTCYKRIVNGKDSLNWAVCGYSKDKLVVQASGDSGLEEMVEEFSDSKVQYGFVRVNDTKTELPKLVFITWRGESAPDIQSRYLVAHLADIRNIFRGFHVEIVARSESDVTPSVILKKVAESSGANYSFHKEERRPDSPADHVKGNYTPPTVVGKPTGSIKSKFDSQSSSLVSSSTGAAGAAAAAAAKERELAIRRQREEFARKEAEERELEENRQKEKEQKEKQVKQAVPVAAAKDESQHAFSNVSFPNTANIASKFNRPSISDSPSHGNSPKSSPLQTRAAVGQKQTSPPAHRAVVPARKVSDAKNPVPSVAASASTEKQPAEPFGGVSFPKTSSLASKFQSLSTSSDPASPRRPSRPGAPGAATTSVPAAPVPSPPAPSAPRASSPPAPPAPSFPNAPARSFAPVSTSRIPEPPHLPDSEVQMTTNSAPKAKWGVKVQQEEPEESKDDWNSDADHAISHAAGITPSAMALSSAPVVVDSQHSGLTAHASYDYTAAEDNELSFKEGDLIVNIEKVDDGWWHGTGPDGKSGLFPANYVVESEATHETAPSQPHQVQDPSGFTCVTLFDYTSEDPEDLTFVEGETLTNCVDLAKGWCSGSNKDGKHGHFPSNYVQRQ